MEGQALKLSPQEQLVAALGFVDLEPAFEGIEVIELASGDIESAFGIDDDPHAGSFDQDIARGRAILEIHLILQPGTTAADDRHPQNSLRTTLFA